MSPETQERTCLVKALDRLVMGADLDTLRFIIVVAQIRSMSRVNLAKFAAKLMESSSLEQGSHG